MSWAPKGKSTDDMKKAINATDQTKAMHAAAVRKIEELDGEADGSDKERAAKKRRVADDSLRDLLKARVHVQESSGMNFDTECGYLWPVPIFKKHFPDRAAAASVIICSRLPHPSDGPNYYYDSSPILSCSAMHRAPRACNNFKRVFVPIATFSTCMCRRTGMQFYNLLTVDYCYYCNRTQPYCDPSNAFQMHVEMNYPWPTLTPTKNYLVRMDPIPMRYVFHYSTAAIFLLI